MRVYYGEDAGPQAAVAGTAGTALARHLVQAVLAHAEHRRLVGADWRVVELSPRLRAAWEGVRPLVLAITSCAGQGPVSSAGLELLDACRVVAARLPADGLLVLNGDDCGLAEAWFRTPASLVRVGLSASCDLVPQRVCWDAGRLEFELAGQGFSVAAAGFDSLPGALAAVLIGRRLGLDWAEIARALAENEPPPRCSQASRIMGRRRAPAEERCAAIAGQFNEPPDDSRAGGWRHVASAA